MNHLQHTTLAPSPESLWPHYLAAGDLTLLCGAAQIGLTSLVLDWAACVTTGAPFPDQADDAARRGPGRVLFCCDAPTRRTIRRRLAAAGVNGDLVDDEQFDQDDDHAIDLRAIAARLAAGGHSVVVFDALRFELWRDGMLSAESEMVCRSLAHLADEHAVAVLACVRLAQPFQGSVPRRAIGAVAACNAATSAFAVVADEAFPQQRAVHCVRGAAGLRPLVFRLHRLPGEQGLRLQWQVNPSADRDGALVSDDLHAQTALARAAAWLLRLLSDGPAYCKTLEAMARAEGHSIPTIRRARVRLGLEKKRVLCDGTPRTYWELPATAWRSRQRPDDPGVGAGEVGSPSAPSWHLGTDNLADPTCDAGAAFDLGPADERRDLLASCSSCSPVDQVSSSTQ